MALVTQSFAEHYQELVSAVPTHGELLLDVQRREVGERKALEEKCQEEFQDVLHVAAVMITDKKSIGRGPMARMNRFEIALYQKQRAVWFPAAPPRQVAFTGNRSRAFPHAAFAKICQEEREIRQWHFCVERRLREHIEEACGRVWFYLNLMQEATTRENLSRQRLQREEDEAFLLLRQRFFRAVPASYYRHIVVTRYGSTAPQVEKKDQSFDELESHARGLLLEEEENSRRSMFRHLQEVYDLQLFSLNHHEVIHRYELEEEECNALYPLIAQCCREDFGLVFYHIPALAWHVSSSFPCLRALCSAHLEEAPRRTAAIRSRLSWIPAMARADACLDNRDEREEAGEAEVGANGDNNSQSGPAVSVDSSPASPVTEATIQEMVQDDVEEVVCTRVSEMGSVHPEEQVEPEKSESPLEVPITSEIKDTSVSGPGAPTESDSAPEDSSIASPSYRNTEVPLARKPLSRVLFSSFEVFVGDPFALTPKPGEKSRASKKRN